MGATAGRVAAIGRADVAVATVQCGTARALAPGADIIGSAGILIIAGQTVILVKTAGSRVTGISSAAIAVTTTQGRSFYALSIDTSLVSIADIAVIAVAI